jgi:DNA-binding transcriptional LysR family regulator
MVLQQLAYLVALAREGHFGRAAASCHVTQPTLSVGIRRLEDELAVQLVRRGRRYAGLTAEGERVLVWAQRVTADAQSLRGDVAALRSGLTGEVRLGAIPTSLSSVSLLTTPFCDANPGVTVTVRSLSSKQIQRGLTDFELDAGITYLDNEPLEQVQAVPLYREQYVLLTAADGRFGDRDRVTWPEAASLELCLLTPDMQNRRIVDALFRRAGVEPRPVIETNSVTVLFAHVHDGGRASVMADAWLRLFDVPAGLRALPLVSPEASHLVGLVVLDREPTPLVVRALVDQARGLADERGPAGASVSRARATA